MTGFKHGLHGTPAYKSWMSMLNRCNNPNAEQYPRYGGRGIKVCERWQDFRNFYADMGERPRGTTLERRRPNEDYSPDNCEWATPVQQGRTRTNNVFIEHDGRRMIISDWAKITGLKENTIKKRFYRYGHAPAKLFAPVGSL